MTQTGALNVGGAASFTAGANPIALLHSNQVTAATFNNGLRNDAAFRSATSLQLGFSAIGANLILIANGAISQSGPLVVPGTSSFSAVGNILLTQGNQFVGAASFNTGGPYDVSLSNARSTVMGASSIGRDLVVTSSGPIAQVGILSVGRTASFTGGSTSLTQANQFSNRVDLASSPPTSDVSLVNAIPLILGASTIGRNLALSVPADSTITLTGNVSASLSLTLPAPVSLSDYLSSPRSLPTRSNQRSRPSMAGLTRKGRPPARGSTGAPRPSMVPALRSRTSATARSAYPSAPRSAI